MSYFFDSETSPFKRGSITFNNTDIVNSFTTQFTIAFWYKIGARPLIHEFPFIIQSFSEESGITYNHVSFEIEGGLSQFYLLGLDNLIYGNAINSHADTNNIWAHVAGVANLNTQKVKLYFNGELDPEGGIVDTTLTSFNFPSSVEFINVIIGNIQSTMAVSFIGSLSEFAIWNKELTQSEIRRLASKIRRVPLQLQRSNLKLYVPMDDHPWADKSLSTGTVNFAQIQRPSSWNVNVTPGIWGDTDIITYP